MKDNYKKKHVTSPNFISSIYFNFIYKKIIDFLDYEEKKIILDFGSGLGLLKKKIINQTKHSVINYDRINELSEVEDWRQKKFDIIIFSQVLYLFSPHELRNLLFDLKKHNSELIIINVLSTQSLLNKIGKILLAHADAHLGTKISPREEEDLLSSHCELIKIKNYFNVFKILKLKFKN